MDNQPVFRHMSGYLGTGIGNMGLKKNQKLVIPRGSILSRYGYWRASECAIHWELSEGPGWCCCCCCWECPNIWSKKLNCAPASGREAARSKIKLGSCIVIELMIRGQTPEVRRVDCHVHLVRFKSRQKVYPPTSSSSQKEHNKLDLN